MAQPNVPRLEDYRPQAVDLAARIQELERRDIAEGRDARPVGQLREIQWRYADLAGFKRQVKHQMGDADLITLGQCMIWQLTTAPKNNIGHLMTFLAQYARSPTNPATEIFGNTAFVAGGNVIQPDDTWTRLLRGEANHFEPYRQGAINFVYNNANTGVALPEAATDLSTHPICADMANLSPAEKVAAYTVMALFLCRSVFTFPNHMTDTWKHIPDLLTNTYKLPMTLTGATWPGNHANNWESLNKSMPARSELMNAILARCIELDCTSDNLSYRALMKQTLLLKCSYNGLHGYTVASLAAKKCNLKTGTFLYMTNFAFAGNYPQMMLEYMFRYEPVQGQEVAQEVRGHEYARALNDNYAANLRTQENADYTYFLYALLSQFDQQYLPALDNIPYLANLGPPLKNAYRGYAAAFAGHRRADAKRHKGDQTMEALLQPLPEDEVLNRIQNPEPARRNLPAPYEEEAPQGPANPPADNQGFAAFL